MKYLLETTLDDRAEDFVLNMWRMLIFEIKKVETVKLADHISNADPKEERCEGAMEINMRTGNMSSLDRDYSDIDDVVLRNSVGDVSTMLSVTTESDIGQSSKAPLHSGFHESDYVDGANKEKKTSPRVSIEYLDVKKKQKIFDGEVYQDLAFDGMKLSLHDKKLIDMIPNAKDEVLSYEINWDVSDQHELHKKMRPWISKKILEFLKEDADRTVECLLMTMSDHVSASRMLEMLQVMFLDEAEMFFLNLWRMLIFEIKKKVDVSEIATQEKSEVGRAINMRSGDKSTEQDRDWNDLKSNNLRVVNVDKICDSDSCRDLLNLLRTFDLKMLLEVEQFIDVIPKTKEMLFSCEINWALSDKHELHKKMTPWISENVTEFLEEDGDVLVDMIVYCIEHHICASRVLEMIQLLLKDEGEMFFLQFWRMLIFEIKKVETVAKFAKQFSNVHPKKERSEVERATNTRSGDNLSQQDLHCEDVESSSCARDTNKDIIRDSKSYQQHVLLLDLFGSKRVWDLEQFIDMIPKTKEELFLYEINWDLFDEHENMRPWILEKLMEFYERREAITVDYIVTSIKDHATSSQMVHLLQPTLGDQTEKFALNMLRMLIFEIKKVGTVDLDQKTIDSNRYPGLRSILKVYDTAQHDRVNWVAETTPKTKEVLFSYKINWKFYEQYGLKWNMRRWLSLEITDFVGRREDVNLVVDYILSSIDDHVPALRMQERLQPILGDKCEMFVEKMWSTIIFGTRLVHLTRP